MRKTRAVHVLGFFHVFFSFKKKTKPFVPITSVLEALFTCFKCRCRIFLKQWGSECTKVMVESAFENYFVETIYPCLFVFLFFYL